MLSIQYVLYNLLQDSKTFPLARVTQYTSVTSFLSTEVSLTCYGRRARLSPRAMAPSTKKENSGQPAPVDVFQRIDVIWDRGLDKIMRYLEQHPASLEQDARQPRLAMEADGHANTKTRERTEGPATAVQVMRGDGFSARRAEPGPNTNPTSFGVKAEPPTLPCRDDVVVESGDAAPRSCPPSLEMRSPVAAGGLLPAGDASTATRTTFNEPLLRFYATEDMNPEEDSKKEKLWTSIPSVWYDSSFWKLLAAPYCRRVVETKSRQNRTFDPGGSQGHLRACPFFGIMARICLW